LLKALFHLPNFTTYQKHAARNCVAIAGTAIDCDTWHSVNPTLPCSIFQTGSNQAIHQTI
jgi:hypothetical protein